jgi:L-threonylcarbamoyladenylate synthase
VTSRITRDPAEAAEMLTAGKVVALPTETVYGLGGHAFDAHAVAAVFAAKDRPHFDPLIVHLADIDSVSDIAADFPEPARRLADAFWPGPLTLVLPKRDLVPDLVTAGLRTVAVRVPAHPLMRHVLELTGFPIAAPSANLFGRLSPTTAEHVHEQLGDRIELILDGGPCRVGLESTIVGFRDGRPQLLRPGGVSFEEIERIVGPVTIPTQTDEQQPAAPGQLPSHYAPRTPLIVTESVPDPAPEPNSGALLIRPRPVSGYSAVEVLSRSGDLTEAAANFFSALNQLDRAGLAVVFAEWFPELGLGRALNDRLRRAADRN